VAFRHERKGRTDRGGRFQVKSTPREGTTIRDSRLIEAKDQLKKGSVA
jgi:hypothetical protein